MRTLRKFALGVLGTLVAASSLLAHHVAGRSNQADHDNGNRDRTPGPIRT
jgi:hypothetical protein